MYTIGQFSKLTGVSTKTLIWYDNVGVLKPEKVDEDNGYRYYSDESLKKLVDIYFWKSMDFSVKEIVNLSQGVIDDKIKVLQKKINFINFNMNLLKDLKDENVEDKDLSIFKLGDRDINGHWLYRNSSTNFKEIDDYTYKKVNDSMPKHLFFGNDIATDTKSIIEYDDNGFSLKDDNGNVRTFVYFILNHSYDLILCELPSDDKANKRIEFHRYNKYNREQKYSADDIKKIYDKCQPQDEKYSSDIKINTSLLGEWKVYDEIAESQVDTYDGDNKGKEKVHYTLFPLYENLIINEYKEVITMKEEDRLRIHGTCKEIILTRDNTIMPIMMSKNKNDEFAIKEIMTKQQKLMRGKYRKINDEEYLFINLDNFIELDERVYVFKKVNSSK